MICIFCKVNYTLQSTFNKNDVYLKLISKIAFSCPTTVIMQCADATPTWWVIQGHTKPKYYAVYYKPFCFPQRTAEQGVLFYYW